MLVSISNAPAQTMVDVHVNDGVALSNQTLTGRQRVMSVTVKDQITVGLDKLVGGLKAPELRKNEGKFYVETFLWQELSSIADKRLKESWAAAQGKDGVIETDDEMRARGTGEHIVSESGSFSCVAKLSAARKVFDRDRFIATAATTFKVKPAVIIAMLDKCTSDGKLPLNKRILEA